MQCIQCGHKNPGAVLYCQKCGVKLDMTADEIQKFYAERVRDEKLKATEQYAQRTLSFALVVLVIALLVLMFSRGAPRGAYYVPSATVGSEYIKEPDYFNPQIRKLRIPFEEERK